MTGVKMTNDLSSMNIEQGNCDLDSSEITTSGIKSREMDDQVDIDNYRYLKTTDDNMLNVLSPTNYEQGDGDLESSVNTSIENNIEHNAVSLKPCRKKYK